MAARVIDAVLRLRDEFTQPFGESLKLMTAAGKQGNAVRKQIDKMGKSITDVGNKLTASVTVPIVGAGVAAVKNFADVDKTMQLVNATMGNTEDQAKLISDAMKNAASNSTFGMGDAANAALNFARAGLSAEEAAAAIAPAMNLAAGEGGDLDTVSAGLVATINGFGDKFSETGHYADVFAAACNNSALDVDTLSNAMSVAAPIFSSAGYGVEDAALMLGVMANNGIDADKAANSLKTGLARLVSPAKDGATMMEKLGLSFTNSDGTMKSTMRIQKELHDTFGKLSESEQIAAASAIFGKNQMAPWLALINTAPKDVNELKNSLAQCSGTTDDMAGAMMSGLGGSMERIKSSIDVLAYSFGEVIAPAVQIAADKIQEIVDKFNDMSPEQKEQIVKWAGIAAAVGPCLVLFGKAVSGVSKVSGALSNLGSVFSIATKAGGGLKGMFALIGSPIGIAIGAIVALATIIAIVITHIDQFKEAFGTVMDAVSPHLEKLKEAFSNLWSSIKPIIEFIGDLIANFLVGAISGAAQGISEIIIGITDTINGIADIVSGVVDFVMNIINGDFDAAWESAKKIVSGFYDFIKGIFEAVGGVIDGAIGAVFGGIEKAGKFVSGLFGGKKDMQANVEVTGTTVGANAGGTDFWRGGLTRVNERGGEIIDLPRGSRVYPHDESIDMARAQGSITIAKLADSIVVREDADIDRIATAIVSKIQKASERRGGYSYRANMA